MPVFNITLTDDAAVACEARVVWLQQQAELIPPPFPPVTPVADVEALIASYMEAPIRSLLAWHATQ